MNDKHGAQSPRHASGLTILSALVILSASLVRLYNLGTPSMWWDEVLAAIMSSYPADYIISWSRQCEVNPPLFIFLVSKLRILGSSDEIIRMPWAVLGIIQVIVAYLFFAKYVSRSTGLVVATLLAACPLQILITRQLRPYPMLLLLGMLSFVLMRQWLAKPKTSTLILLALINGAISSLHYLGLPLVGSQFVFAAYYFLTSGTSCKPSDKVLYFAANILTYTPGLYFFKTITIRSDMLMSASMPDVIQKLLKIIDTIFSSYAFPVILDESSSTLSFETYIVIAMVAVISTHGFIVLKKNDKIIANMLAACFIVPTIAIIISGQGFFRPRHIYPFVVPVVMFAGCSLAHMLSRKPKSLGLALWLSPLLPVATASNHFDEFYKINSYGDYKTVAEIFEKLPVANSAYSGRDQQMINAVSWYIDQSGKPNVFRTASATPDTSSISFNYLTESSLTYLWPKEYEFIRHLPQPSGAGLLYDLPMLTWTMERTPVLSLDDPGQSIVLDMSPTNVLSKSHSFGGIMLHPVEGSVTAAKNNVPGELAYALDLDGDRPANFLVEARYKTSGPGNQLVINYALDGGEMRQGYSSAGHEPGQLSFGYFTVSKDRDAKRLILSCTLLTGLQVPDYPGGNLATNALYSLRIKPLADGSDTFGLNSVTVYGLSKAEAILGTTARWAEGPEMKAVIYCPEGKTLKATLSYASTFSDQDVRVFFNGAPLALRASSGPSPWTGLFFDIAAKEGRNELSFSFGRYNHRKGAAGADTFSPKDPRKLAIIVRELTIGGVDFIH